MSFIEKLDDESMKFFEEVASKPFSLQGVAFLNAYWPEVGDQAEFIYNVAYDHMKKADMHAKGIQLLYQYEEGKDVDFDIGLYFYEKLCKFLDEDGKKAGWTDEKYKLSQPDMMTALKRKQELRDKVDVNFDGRVSFLEYLLYQYQDVANPADFCTRSMGDNMEEHEEIRKARAALEEVNKRIREYEAEKARLEAESEGTGVKALKAKNLLAQLGASPLAEALNMALIKAEAAVRKAQKLFGGTFSPGGTMSGQAGPTPGSMWWMNKDLEEKKRLYGNRK